MVHWCCVKKKRPSSSSCAAPFLGGRQRLHPPSAAFAWASHQYHTRLFLPEAPQLPAAVASSWTRSIKAPLLTTLESCQLTLPRPVTKSQSFFVVLQPKKRRTCFTDLDYRKKKGKKTNFVERERARQVDRPSRWMAQRAENYRTTSTVSSWIRWVVQLTSSSSPSAWWTVPVFFSFDPSVQLSEKTEGNRKLHRRNNTRRSWKKIKEEKDKRTMAMASVASSSSSSIQQLLFVVLSLQTIICHGKSSAPTL